MTAHPRFSDRFVRKTRLAAGEYRRNFRQIDREIISVVTSREADLVTPLMSKIYLQLINAPTVYWEQEGVLRFESQPREEGKSLKAWMSLCELLGVASATARKALSWMHDVGVIGYFAGKNGVGIRIFINRAASSIGNRLEANGKNVLRFRHTSPDVSRASRNEAAFNDSFAVLESSDLIINPHAPKTGANEKAFNCTDVKTVVTTNQSTHTGEPERESQLPSHTSYATLSTNEIVQQLKSELQLSFQQTARQAASREHERTREWLEKRGLPKAARVAQREAFNVLRKFGLINHLATVSHVARDVGRTYDSPITEHALSCEEIEELAGACVAMLETKGQSIDLTLSEMSAETGGFLQFEDTALVREKVNALLSIGVDKELDEPCQHSTGKN